MKKAIVYIFVCMLLIAIVLPATSAMNLQTARYMKENHYSEPYPSTPAFSLGFITIKIVAEVTSVKDPYNLLGGAIHVNDTMTGKYIYNSRASDLDSDPNIGSYMYSSPPNGIELKTGDFVFKTDPSNIGFWIEIANDIVPPYGPPQDDYGVASLNNLPLSNGMLVYYIQWTLIDTTATALSSADLPTTAPRLTDWTDRNQVLIDGMSPSNPDESYRILANVTKATKPIAIDIHGADSDWNAPSMAIPFQFNLLFMKFWMKLLERFPLLENLLSILCNHLERNVC